MSLKEDPLQSRLSAKTATLSKPTEAKFAASIAANKARFSSNRP